MTHFRKLCIAALAAFGLLWGQNAHAQGTIPLALAQQVDQNGQPLAGCLLYTYVAGTVATPQNAYQDFGLSQPLPNPMQCDITGRVPMFWLANGLIHARLTTAAGLVVVDTTMQVLGPSSGGGGGGGGGTQSIRPRSWRPAMSEISLHQRKSLYRMGDPQRSDGWLRHRLARRSAPMPIRKICSFIYGRTAQHHPAIITARSAVA